MRKNLERIFKARKFYKQLVIIICYTELSEKFKVVLHNLITRLFWYMEEKVGIARDESILHVTEIKFIQSINQQTWDKMQNDTIRKNLTEETLQAMLVKLML